jgi:hypothetical protein
MARAGWWGCLVQQGDLSLSTRGYIKYRTGEGCNHGKGRVVSVFGATKWVVSKYQRLHQDQDGYACAAGWWPPAVTAVWGGVLLLQVDTSPLNGTI